MLRRNDSRVINLPTRDVSDERILQLLNIRPGLRAWQVGDQLGEDPYEVYPILRKFVKLGMVEERGRRYFPVYEPDPDVLWGFESEFDEITCEKCKGYHGDTFTEPQVIAKFEYVRKIARMVWRPQVHPHCRCRLIRLVAMVI